MTLTPEVLRQQWEGIDYKDGGFLQINIQHSLEWYIGYQSISQRTLLLLSNMDIDSIESSKSILVSRRRREFDNRWILTFELLRNEQQDVFAILCCDIINYSCFVAAEQEALSLVTARYRQWAKLLESQKKGVMDEHMRKGLLGELLFLEKYMDSCHSILYAINGWSGPEGSDQDFMYSEGWYEIKTVGISSSNVTISSLEQLDCDELGELVIMRIDKVSPSKPNAISLNDIVNRIRKKLSINSEATEVFQQKLISYGYIELQEYSETKYHFSKTQRYVVNESFPRLIKENVPNEIVSSSYELNLPSLDKWLKG
ncbi:PD-(D/E)XK motif protein [Yersinia enterocolitica]|nr:PD-(D/E)XK motif protein [Yersinia enterocolitica]